MTDTIAIAFLLLSLGWLVNALATLVNVWLTYRNSKELQAQAKAMHEVAHNTNSIKDELVAEVRAASFAAGKKSKGNEKISGALKADKP